ncbi:MAG TPA: glycerate kinase [Anaerolineales bacterium]
MDPDRLRTHSLDRVDASGRVGRILAAGLQAVDPAATVRRHVRRDDDRLRVGEHSYDLTEFHRVLVVGAGKAGAPMAQAIEGVLGDRTEDGVIIVKQGYAGHAGSLSIVEAGHPIPDARGVAGAEDIIHLLQGVSKNDLMIGLISGGGSALLVSPQEGISLEDLQNLTAALLASGADIYEINTLRKHLERLKGGQLARLAAPAQMATLILSDVVGDPLDMIASGPTVPDTSTFKQAYDVLARYQLLESVPQTIIRHLQGGIAGDIPENPKPGDPLFENVHNLIVGSNSLAAQAAVAKAREEGFNTLLLTTYLQGEARQAGRLLAAIARQLAATGQPLERPACVVVGGETTVTLQGEGLGGRNQEMALGAVKDMSGLEQAALVCLATDGGDGPTHAAGAVVTGETLARARQQALDPQAYLARNDAYNFFQPLGDLLVTGPTMTNVNDLALLFVF